MATNNSNNLKVLKRGIKDSTPMEVDHLELRVRNRHGHEIFLRVTPSDVTRDLNLPSSSNWDWHPAQVRILHKIQQKVFTPGPSSSASTKPSSSTDNSNVSEPPKLAHPVVEDDNISDLTSDSDTQPQDVHLISLEINLKLRYSSLKDIIESCCWSRETKGLIHDLAEDIYSSGYIDSSDPCLIFISKHLENTQKAEEFLLRMTPSERFERVQRHVDQVWGEGSYTRLFKTKSGVAVQMDNLTELLNMKSNDIVKVTFVRRLPINDADDAYITIKVRGIRDTQGTFHFMMRPTSTFEKLLKLSSGIWQGDRAMTRWLYNGHRITSDDTPQSLSMENGDIIDCIIADFGGGPLKRKAVDEEDEDEKKGGELSKKEATQPPNAKRRHTMELQKKNEEDDTKAVTLLNPEVSNNKATPTPETPEHAPAKLNGKITLKVKDDRENELFFRLFPDTPLSKVMESCKKAWPDRNLRFVFNGTRILGEDTPAKLEMEDDDMVCALLEAFGGR